MVGLQCCCMDGVGTVTCMGSVTPTVALRAVSLGVLNQLHWFPSVRRSAACQLRLTRTVTAPLH